VNDEIAQYCTTCQAPLSQVSGYQPMQSVNQVAQGMTDYKALGADKKIIAGILGILLGGFGVHKFILGIHDGRNHSDRHYFRYLRHRLDRGPGGRDNLSHQV
jgi:TM2 domain-containing protein